MVAKTDVEAGGVREEIPHDHLFIVTGLSSSNLEKLSQETSGPGPAEFETAIEATGYGWFNVWLMLCTLPAFWCAVSVTSATSYIFTQAQCQMGLRLVDMGTLNAMTYGGMIVSAVIWGFLSDTLGRRKIIVWGLIGTGIIEVISAFSQNFTMLLIMRFSSGFLFNGSFAVLVSYLAELHRTQLRARVILLTSLFFTIANTTLPLLAWALLTREWHFKPFGDVFVIHAWNLFLLATAIVPLFTGLAFLCLPESPKFLMSRGRNEEAMVIFKRIYALNTGKSPESYPITKLVEEKSEQQGQGLEALKAGMEQMLPLFRAPHLLYLVLICGAHVGCMFGSNTLRLWYPQLAAMIGTEESGSLCAAISPTASREVEEACQPIATDMLTYLQSAIVGAGSVLTYTIGGAVINRCGKKLVAGMCCVLSAVVIALMPLLGTTPAAVVWLLTAALALTSLAGASLSSITVDLFPTSLRVMAMSIFLMMGRVGTVTGTVTFPALIAYGCLPPFFTIAGVLAVCGCACFFVPNTTLKKLE
ncbi:synaptic vesicle glycoprotein 2A-like isoform X2 [Leptidea sinapis]|uniref:synaptic vesicle glycoprotein 2A-like isoform X2 n=1 Tax=Leptidea sinapis TaxID=189913 RepID=UPI0021436D39|nr:synaptic vesicle glycoprotein 2A-like isoform X2 [Leptidea sinapis]